VLFLEIAAQGVKGVSPSGGSARLRPGYNVVPVDGPVLRRLLEALFYPEARDAELFRAAAPAHGTIRAGVTVIGNDGITYRVVRDFAAGCQLHRFDPAKRAFTLVSQELPGIAEYLGATVGVPTRGRLAMLTVCIGDLPSRCAMASASAPLLGAPRPPLAPDQVEKRKAELREELDRSRKAEKLQYKLDGLQSRLFKLEEVLKERTSLRESLATAESTLASMGPAVAVAERLGDLDVQLAAHGKAVAKRDEALAKIEAERDVLDTANVRGQPVPFWKDPRFWAGAGTGALAVLAAFAGSGTVLGLRYVALLDIPAFGWAAWVALGWVTALESHGRLGRRSRLVEEHERKVLETCERDTLTLREAVKALGLAGIAELKEALDKLAHARRAVADAGERLQAFEARPEMVSAQGEKTRVEAELSEVEVELTGQAGGFVRDVRSVEMEMRRLEEEAALEDPATRAPEHSTAAVDALQDLLERAAVELGGSAAAVARSVQPKGSQLLQAFSGERLTGLGVDDRGNLLVQVSGRSVPAAGLPPVDRDLVFLALKLGVIERALSDGKLVALADDVFAGLPEAARRRAGRMLKQVARSGQLLHATADVAFRESADHLA
jgi:hypothetical protein